MAPGAALRGEVREQRECQQGQVGKEAARDPRATHRAAGKAERGIGARRAGLRVGRRVGALVASRTNRAPRGAGAGRILAGRARLWLANGGSEKKETGLG